MPCPSQSSRLRFLLLLGEEYGAYGLALCNFLRSLVIILSLKYLSILFSNNLDLCFSFKVRDQKSK